MMRSLLFLILFVSQHVFAQVNSIYPKVPYTDLQYIAVEGNNIFTSGDCDVAMLSTDGGDNWTTFQMTERVLNIKVVPNSNGQKAFYMTKDDLFVLDINTLGFDKVSNSNLTLMAGTFRSLEVLGSKVYVIAGAAIFQSDLGTYEWTKLGDLSFDDNDDYVRKSDVGTSLIFVGSDQGEFQSVNTSTGEVLALYDFGGRFSKIDMVDDNLGYADISTQSSIVKTTDGGNNWSSLSNMPENINPVAYGNNVIMSINTNRIYVSLDGGASSTYVPIPEDGQTDLISAAFMTPDGKLYLSGRSSMVLRSDDFASSFINLNPYNRADLAAIHINDADIGYAVGSSGSVIKTTNKGVDWDVVDLGFSTDSYLSCVASYADGRLLIGHDMGLAVFENDVMVEELDITTDVLFQSRNSDNLIAIQAAAGSYAIAVSNDRGATWENKAMVPGSYYRIHQSPTGKIYIPSGEDIVYTSVDDGNTWEIETFGFSDVGEVSFLDDQNGIFVSDGKLYKTSDGGTNGLEIASGYLLANIHYFDEDLMMYTNGQNSSTNVRESENGGSSFSTKSSYCTTTRGSYYDGSQTLWLAMRGGHINKHVFEALPSNTNDQEWSQFSVYPNPVHQGGSIRLASFSETQIDVEIYSITGQIMLNKNISSNQSISLDGIEKGTYVIIAKSEEGIKTSRLVIN